MRWLSVTWRLRHLSLWAWWFSLGVTVIPALWRIDPSRPYCWVTWPWRSGGTLVVKAGPLFFIVRA
jgi:hypothetical protein